MTVTGPLHDHAGPALHVVRDIVPSRLRRLLLWISQAAIRAPSEDQSDSSTDPRAIVVPSPSPSVSQCLQCPVPCPAVSCAVLQCPVPCPAVCYTVLQCAILSCSVLYCPVVCYTVLQCAILSCSVLYCPAVCYTVLQCAILSCSVLYCPAVCYTVLQCAILSCSVLYCPAVCYTVLQCAILSCSVLYCPAVCYTVLQCAILSCSVLYCPVVCYTVLQCAILSCSVLYCPAVCYTVLQCAILSCSVLYCPVVSCHVLHCVLQYLIRCPIYSVLCLLGPHPHHVFSGHSSPPSYRSLIAGILPFGAIFVELFFILTAVWENQFYYLFGFLFLVFVILIIACSEVAIVMTYFQLCGEVSSCTEWMGDNLQCHVHCTCTYM